MTQDAPRDDADLTENGYYYNLTSGEVEKGLVSPWTQRMGPYRTAAEASAALETARKRSQSWDAEDRRWAGSDE
ncbi:hypothetical protein [Miniimonas arenae]|uniref:hypothetical protein n=1 Tax=Miniimonas arenae TaxID=676201 RepID=UPI0015D60898|nr:hypothetical protein [Miniimonas arenae]